MNGTREVLIKTMSIEIGAPPERIWEMLALDRWKEWDEGTQKMVKRVEFTSDILTPKDKYRVGATANLIGKKDQLYLTCKVTESLENEKIGYRLNANHWVSQIAQTFILEPIEKGT
jgi:Polyketide cyclase / dehydrase and lipid transport